MRRFTFEMLNLPSGETLTHRESDGGAWVRYEEALIAKDEAWRVGEAVGRTNAASEIESLREKVAELEKKRAILAGGREDLNRLIENLRAKVAELEKERDALIAVGRRMYEMPTDRHTYAVLDAVREMVKNASREAEGGSD